MPYFGSKEVIDLEPVVRGPDELDAAAGGLGRHGATVGLIATVRPWQQTVRPR